MSSAFGRNERARYADHSAVMFLFAFVGKRLEILSVSRRLAFTAGLVIGRGCFHLKVIISRVNAFPLCQIIRLKVVKRSRCPFIRNWERPSLYR